METPPSIYGWGMFGRIISMLVILMLPISQNAKILWLFISDNFDCWLIKIINIFSNKKNKRVCKKFNYQGSDKIIDILTYFIILVSFDLPPLFLYIAIYRLIGVVVFVFKQDSSFLTFFPDIFKELYLWNQYVSPINICSFSVITIFKMIFEYFFHNWFNGNNYKKIE